MVYIRAGKLFDFLKNLLKSVERVFDKMDFKIEDVETRDDGSTVFTLVLGDNKHKDLVEIKFSMKPIDPKRPEFWDLDFGEDPTTHEDLVFHNVRFNDIKRKLRYVQKRYGYEDHRVEDKDGNMLDDDTVHEHVITESQKLNFTLKKVTSATSTNIILKNVRADYQFPLALRDVSNIIEDDDFIAEIEPDVEVNYEVTSTPDSELNITEALEEMLAPQEYLNAGIDALLVTWYCLQDLLNYGKYRDYAITQQCRPEDLLWIVNDQIDKLSYMNVELTGNTISMREASNLGCLPAEAFVCEQYAANVADLFDNLISGYQLYLYNLPTNKQAEFENTISQLEYILKYNLNWEQIGVVQL